MDTVMTKSKNSSLIANDTLDDLIKDALKAGPLEKNHVCQFCGKGFVRERTLATHLCEPKRRHQQKSEPGVRRGYIAFNIFYKNSTGKTKTYKEFSESPYYKAFVKFGWWTLSINAIGFEEFVEWLLKSTVSLDHWCKDKYYDAFLKHYLKIENTAEALDRSITSMTEWAESKNCPFEHYFVYGNNNVICNDIVRGKISPWTIYCSSSGVDWLGKIDEKQLEMIYDYIEPEYWGRKMRRQLEDTDWCKNILSEAGL